LKFIEQQQNKKQNDELTSSKQLLEEGDAAPAATIPRLKIPDPQVEQDNKIPNPWRVRKNNKKRSS
jgi:hypothetical protein